MNDTGQQTRKSPTVKQDKEQNTQASFKCNVIHVNLHSHLFVYKAGRKIFTSFLYFTVHVEPHVFLKSCKHVLTKG